MLKKIISTLLIVTLLLVCIITISTLYTTFTSFVDINNSEQIISFIQQKTGKNTITIQSTKENQDIYAIYYKTDDSNINLMLLKKSTLPFISGYRFLGKGSSSAQLDTYNFHNYEDNTSIIVVYGTSPKKSAVAYSLEVNSIIYSQNISNINILDIFIIKDSSSATSINSLYNLNGDKIGTF